LYKDFAREKNLKEDDQRGGKKKEEKNQMQSG
jgi:hypothetical protein